jgi:hypothetical protein
MARKHWKQPYSFTLSKDVAKILRDAEQLSDISRSSIVEVAILFWHAEKWNEWKKEFSVKEAS